MLLSHEQLFTPAGAEDQETCPSNTHTAQDDSITPLDCFPDNAPVSFRIQGDMANRGTSLETLKTHRSFSIRELLTSFAFLEDAL